jgi:CRISPR/Cas system-associated exonuclease Cas4 (RecB family)|tara:strand:- start:5378 stop:5587 length:210 start_codon:yes stop_codon:yes gene_type:complete
MIIDNPNHIELYRMQVQKQALKLEMYGMKTRGRSAYALIKEIYNLKGSKQRVYEQFTALIEAKKIMEML